MRSITLILLSLLLLGSASFIACGGGGGGEAARIPTLVGSSPADNATGVARDTFVDLLWEQDLDPTTVTATHVALTAPSGVVPGTLAYDPSTRRIRFSSSDPLVLGTWYTAHVSPGLATTDGQVLQAPYDVSFRVVAAVPGSAQLLETEAIDGAQYMALALNDEGVGFAIWAQRPDPGDRRLRATAFDLASGPGAVTTIAAAESIGTIDEGVAVNSAGDAIVSWTTQGGTQNAWARMYLTSSDTWTPAIKLNVTPGETARDTRVGIDAAGNALVVWSQQAGFAMPEDLWFRQFLRDTGWTGATRLETMSGAARGVQVAVHPTGRTCVVWHQEHPTVLNIYARRFDLTAGWSGVEPLESDDTTRALFPQVAVAPSGDILVCWYQEEGAAHTDNRMWANYFVAGGGAGSGWQGEVMLRDDEGENRGIHLKMDESGNAIVGWQQYVNPNHHAYARRLPVGGSWEDVVTVSGSNDYGIDSWGYRLAMTPTGRTVAAWSQTNQDSSKSIWAREFVPGSGWGQAHAIDGGGVGDTPTARLAVDPEGNCLVAWRQSVYDMGGAYLRNDVWLNTYGPGSGWSSAVLAEGVEVSTALNQAVRMDRHGRGVVVWSLYRDVGSETDLYYKILR